MFEYEAVRPRIKDSGQWWFVEMQGGFGDVQMRKE